MHEARFHKLGERSLHGIAGSYPHARPFDSFVVEINPSLISFTRLPAIAIEALEFEPWPIEFQFVVFEFRFVKLNATVATTSARRFAQAPFCSAMAQSVWSAGFRFQLHHLCKFIQ